MRPIPIILRISKDITMQVYQVLTSCEVVSMNSLCFLVGCGRVCEQEPRVLFWLAGWQVNSSRVFSSSPFLPAWRWNTTLHCLNYLFWLERIMEISSPSNLEVVGWISTLNIHLDPPDFYDPPWEAAPKNAFLGTQLLRGFASGWYFLRIFREIAIEGYAFGSCLNTEVNKG